MLTARAKVHANALRASTAWLTAFRLFLLRALQRTARLPVTRPVAVDLVVLCLKGIDAFTSTDVQQVMGLALVGCFASSFPFFSSRS